MLLTSVESVIDAIGPATAAELAGVGPSAVSNWKARGKIPPELFLLFAAELGKTDTEADPSLFGLKQPVEARA